MRKTRKPLAAAIALALVAALGAGATLAWLTDKSGPVTNTFTVGNIDIDLWEHDYIPEANALDMDANVVQANADYKMVPGTVLPKDPTVTVKADSEDCWLFVKVEETANFDGYMEYGYAEGWRIWLSEADQGDGTKAAVLYRAVESTSADKSFGILAGDKVGVLTSVTKEMMDALEAEGAVLPKLTFTAYAVQMAGFDSAAEAWEATFGA